MIFSLVGTPIVEVVKAKQHLKQEIKKFLLFAKNDMNFMNFSFVMLVMFFALMYFKLSTKGMLQSFLLKRSKHLLLSILTN